MKDKRVLVLFFSRAGDNYKVGKVKKGNTAFLAEHIAEITDADIFEITSKKNYDIPYTEMLKVVREEWKMMNTRSLTNRYVLSINMI